MSRRLGGLWGIGWALAALACAAGSLPAQEPGAEPGMPVLTLEEALRRSTGLDPDYVAAVRQVDDAEWARRAAISTFILPALSFQTSATRFSTEIFNIGTGEFTTQLVDARLEASYPVFQGGARIFDLRRTGAELESARAGEFGERFRTALETEADFYEVVAGRELARVAVERVRRAEEQLAVARARVVAGAAVRTDSLQLLLEVTRAQVERLQRESELHVARVQLGRRVGIGGPVDAAPLDTVPAPPLPLSEVAAVEEAATRSPRALGARLDEKAASALVSSARAAYMPEVSLFGSWTGFDDRFFPDATTRTLWGLQVRIPIWNQGQREVELARAISAREVAEARRRDDELGLRRNASEAYRAYETARASAELAATGVLVARENLSVQEDRYRAGATTIIDLITAQVDLAEAEAGLVQARFATRLALAGLEALLGRRLFPR